jgi:ABC-type sugar transport system substrate-binding protein
MRKRAKQEEKTMRLRLLSVSVLGIAVVAWVATGTGSAKPVKMSANAACVASATAATKKAKAPVPVMTPTPFNMGANKGKSVWVVNLVTNDLGKGINSGIAAAAKKAGIKVRHYYGDGTVASSNAGFSQANAAGAEGIILLGIDPRTVSTPLRAAIARKTVIVTIFTGSSTDPLPKGIFGYVTPNFNKSGVMTANWLLATSKCDLRAALFGSSTVSIHGQFMKAAAQTIARKCPSCKAKINQVDYGTVATTLGPQVASVLNAGGDWNYVVPVADGFVPLVAPAIKSYPDVKIASHDGVPSNLALMRKPGAQQVLDGAFPPNPWMGWALIDQIGRGFQQKKPFDWTIPDRLVDSTNIGTRDAALWPGWQNYASGFVKAWGLG